MTSGRRVAKQDYPDFEFVRFLAEIGGIYAKMREQKRSYLSYHEWQLWADCAVSCGIVSEDELEAPAVPRNASGFRLAVLKTWSRVLESQALGFTDLQHYRAGLDLVEYERQRQERRDAADRERRALTLSLNAAPKGVTPPKLHAGAAGTL